MSVTTVGKRYFVAWMDEIENGLMTDFLLFYFFGILPEKRERIKSVRIESNMVVLVALGN